MCKFRLLLFAFIGCIFAAGPAAAEIHSPTYPVHGTFLHRIDARRAVVRLEPISGVAEAQTKSLHFREPITLRDNTAFDGLLQADSLHDVTAYQGYVAGIPDDRSITTLNAGDRLSPVHVVDQRGQEYNLAESWSGKTLLVSFVFTRCPDAQICPAISGKYAYLQEHLNPATTHLIEITLDPHYDSPKILNDYAKRYGADAEHWSIVTAEQNQIALLINQFGLSNLENRPGNFEHEDTLAVVGGDGKIIELIPTAGWAPDDVIATVLHHQGGESNFFRRLELSAIAGVISVCGGSTTTGQVVLDSSVFVIGVLFFGGLLYLFARRIWRRGT